MAFFNEILSVQEQKVRYASVHLFSGVQLQCLLEFWYRKYNEFIHFPLFLTLKGSVPKGIHESVQILLHYYHYDSWKILKSPK